MKTLLLFLALLFSYSWAIGQNQTILFYKFPKNFPKTIQQALEKRDFPKAFEASSTYFAQHSSDTAINTEIVLAWIMGYAFANANATLPVDKFLAIIPNAQNLHNACDSVETNQYLKPNMDKSVEQFYIKNISYYEQEKNWKKVFSYKLKLATLSYYTNNFEQLEPRYLYACSIAEQHKLGAKTLIAVYEQLFYFYYGNQRDFEKAYIYLTKLDSLSDKTTDMLARKTLFFAEKGDEERAIEFAQLALDSSVTSLDSFSLVQIYAQLTNIYLNQNQLIKSSNYLKKLETIEQGQRAKNTSLSQLTVMQAFLSRNLADLQVKQAAFAKTTSPYTNTVNIIEYMREPEWYIELLQQKPYSCDSFLGKMQQHYAILQQRNQHLLPEFSRQYLAFGNAFMYCKQSDQALTMYNLGLQSATSCLDKKVNLEASNDYRTLLKLLKGKLLAFQQQQTKADTVLETANQAIGLLDKLRQSLSTRGAKETALNSAPFLYEQALFALWQKYQATKDEKWIDQAFQLAEKSKSILLLETLKENEARNFGGVPDSLRQMEKSLLNDISLYEAESKRAQLQQNTARAQLYNGYLANKRAQLEELKKQLEKQYPRYFQLKYNQDIATVQQIQAQLKKQSKQALVELFVGEEQLYIFLIQGDKVHWFAKPRPKTFTNDIRVFYKALTDVSYLKNEPEAMFKDYTTQAHQFYQLFLQDVVAQLAPNTQGLTVISDGLMSYIPMEILLQQPVNNQKVDYKSLAYVIKKYAISYHYSATLWLESSQAKRNKKATKNELLAFAPTYGQAAAAHRSPELKALRKNLNELTGTQAELESIQKIFSGQFLTKEQATEQQFKALAPNYKLIHLAMHGLVNNENPIYSALAFTENNDTTEDNLLNAYELQNMELHADLIVLSACETGYGKYQHGEGVVSLGRGFMYTGIPSVLMTLWAVNDQATAVLMQEFYTELQKGTPKDLALQKAKNAYLEKNDGIALHPMFWSAFVLMGNTEPVSNNGVAGWIWLAAGGLGLAGIAWGILRWRSSKLV